jgi:hypothetical protein
MCILGWCLPSNSNDPQASAVPRNCIKSGRWSLKNRSPAAVAGTAMRPQADRGLARRHQPEWKLTPKFRDDSMADHMPA